MQHFSCHCHYMFQSVLRPSPCVCSYTHCNAMQVPMMLVKHSTYISVTDLLLPNFFCFCDWNLVWKDNLPAPRRYRKMVSRNASKSFMNIGKKCHCSRELLWRKCCVNRCEITYFCAVNSGNFFEAGSTVIDSTHLYSQHWQCCGITNLRGEKSYTSFTLGNVVYMICQFTGL
jgi:hypothetical protein